MKSKIEVLAFDVSETLQTGSETNDGGLGQPMLHGTEVIPGAFSVLVGGKATANLLQEAQRAGIRIVLVTNNGDDLDKAVVSRTLAFLENYGIHLEPDAYMGPPPANSAAASATGGSKVPRLDDAVRRFGIDKSQLRFFDDSRANYEEAVAAGYDSVRVKSAQDLADGIRKAIDSRLESTAQDELTPSLFVKTLNGESISIDLKPKVETIADLKSEIFRKAGIPIQEQILLSGSKELLDSELIKDYALDRSIQLVQKLKQHHQTETPKQVGSTMQLFVKTLIGESISIDLKPKVETIADLKREIFSKTGIPIEEQILLYGMKELLDNELIKDYALNQSIQLVQKLKQHQQTETPTQAVIEEAEKNIATLRGLIAQWKSKTEDLKNRNEPEAYKAAKVVYTALNDTSEAYFADPTKANFIALKTAFENSLDENKNNNRKTLETHRGVKELLGNIVLAILGVGVLYLIAAVANKAINGRFTFFKTESEELIEKTEKELKNRNGPSA